MPIQNKHLYLYQQKQTTMKTLEKQMTEVTKQYGITLKNTLVTYGTIILYANSIEDVNKLAEVLSKLNAKIVVSETDLTVGIVF